MNKRSHFDISKDLPLTPYSLPKVIWDVVENAWAGRDLLFTESYPREPVTKPTIVWSIFRRFSGRESIESNKPRLREQYPGKEPNTIVEQYAQWMTIIYEFDIFDISNESVNTLTDEFDELMFHITPILQKWGTSEWLFDEQVKDVELQRESSQELYKRTLRYRCILERKFIKTLPTIQQIWVQSLGEGIIVQNEQIIRNPNSSKDLLAKTWVSDIAYVDKQPTINPLSSGGYIQGVDFTVSTNFIDGRSYLEWTPRGKHPLPGETYYISYIYMIGGDKIPAFKY